MEALDVENGLIASISKRSSDCIFNISDIKAGSANGNKAVLVFDENTHAEQLLK
jgi:hypothetical protein